MKIEVAVLGPNDRLAPNGVYVHHYNDNFRQSGGTNHTGRLHLVERDAQFHTIDIPDWKDPVSLAVTKLNQLVGDLEWDFQAKRAKQATEVVNLLKGVK